MGRAAAQLFCAAGAKVVGGDLADCAETVKLVEEAGGTITTMGGVAWTRARFSDRLLSRQQES